ncbi:TetR/AcrR family transcriptional regulator [Parablastomonas sp. CN1-191]|uniref:TetR/AcrR family transcriptional regulator n=1 Tax=Parablastomonas sp. CN1-191 TaxID=3400908 RepID=UPI003BF805D5
MPGAPRQRRAATRSADRKPHDVRWAEIVAAATEIFAARGYDATSLQDIADRTGILKGSIYHYIRTKSDLLAHIVRETHEMGLDQVRPIAVGPGSPGAKLEGMIRAHVRFVCENPLRTAVFAHDRKRLDPEQRSAVLGDEHAYRDLFAEVIAAGQAEGTFDPALDVRLSALHLLASMNALHRWWRPGGAISNQAVADHVVATTLFGLSPR